VSGGRGEDGTEGEGRGREAPSPMTQIPGCALVTSVCDERCDAVRSVQSVGRSYIVVTEMQTRRDVATATSSHREGPADT